MKLGCTAVVATYDNNNTETTTTTTKQLLHHDNHRQYFSLFDLTVSQPHHKAKLPQFTYHAVWALIVLQIIIIQTFIRCTMSTLKV